MNRYYCVFVLCFMISCHAFGGVQSEAFFQSQYNTYEDSLVKVLRLKSIKNDKEFHILPGSQIKIKTSSSIYPKKGILSGFAGDSIILDGQKVPLDAIYRIREGVDAGKITMGIVLLIVGIVLGTIGVYYFLWGLLLLFLNDLFGGSKLDPDFKTSNIFLTGLLLFLLTIPSLLFGTKIMTSTGRVLTPNLKKYKKRNIFKAEIVEIPVNQLKK